MNNPSGVAFWTNIMAQVQDSYFRQHLLSWGTAAQILVIGGAILLARLVSGAMKAWVTRQQAQCATQPEAGADLAILLNFVKVIDALIASILAVIAYSIAGHFSWPYNILFAGGMILFALTLVRLFTAQMKNRLLAKILAIAIWAYALFLAALGLGNIQVLWLRFLQSIVFQLGQVHFSLLSVQRAFGLLLALYWVSINLRTLFHFWLTVKSGLASASQILLYRLGSIFLFSACAVIVLRYLGLDLTVFALFGGALGLGLGFGLQKIFANLVSGFILLSDKSIKPGDVIQMGDEYGSINFLGSRYISVVTRDGTEHLIPNENLITSEVINWSYSHNLVRLKVPVGVAYGADYEKASELMLAVAGDTQRVLKEPKPVCLVTGLGDNAINLELRAWINDPQNGVAQVKNVLFRGILQRFRENGVEIPYPQRDVHHKSIPDALLRLVAHREGIPPQ